jgi:Predicted 3-hydroxylacyl-(acyl carrier protein) dehydratase
MKPDPAGIPITELIPQRPPMVLVDTLLHCEYAWADTCFTVPTEGVFVAGGRLTASGLLENMAQTTAARIGYLSLYGPQANGKVRMGVIGLIKQLKISELPAAGSCLHSRMDLLEDWGDMVLAKVRVQLDAEHCASCEMLVSLI